MNALRESLIRDVEFNCDVSDARYWGYFSICGLLMSLRILYMSKRGLEPWSYIDQDEIKQWIRRKEASWEELEEADFTPITIGATSYDPFDVVAINEALSDEGLVYGAGYGLFKKPSFFLAELHDVAEVDGFAVYRAKKELARDLFWSPGLSQGALLFVRLEPLKILLWDKFLESKGDCSPALRFGFAEYGFACDQAPDEEFARRLESVTLAYSDTVLYHEVAEAREDVPIWSDMLVEVNEKNPEFFLRAVKDLIADTSDYGSFKRIIDNRDRGGLGLCIALIDRFRMNLYPEIKAAFEGFVTDEDWERMDEARKAVYARLVSVREEIITMYAARVDTREFIAKLAGLQSKLAV